MCEPASSLGFASYHPLWVPKAAGKGRAAPRWRTEYNPLPRRAYASDRWRHAPDAVGRSQAKLGSVRRVGRSCVRPWRLARSASWSPCSSWTWLASRLDRTDPEDVRDALQLYHSRAKRQIEEYGGT